MPPACFRRRYSHLWNLVRGVLDEQRQRENLLQEQLPSLSIGLIPMLFLQGVFLVMRKQSEEQIWFASSRVCLGVWSSSMQNERSRNKFRFASSESVLMAEHSPMPVTRPALLITPSGWTHQRVADSGDIQISKLASVISTKQFNHVKHYSPAPWMLPIAFRKLFFISSAPVALRWSSSKYKSLFPILRLHFLAVLGQSIDIGSSRITSPFVSERRFMCILRISTKLLMTSSRFVLPSILQIGLRRANHSRHIEASADVSAGNEDEGWKITMLAPLLLTLR